MPDTNAKSDRYRDGDGHTYRDSGTNSNPYGHGDCYGHSDCYRYGHCYSYCYTFGHSYRHSDCDTNSKFGPSS
jgi:hypothetical protein